MRLFTGIALSPNIIDRLFAKMNELRPIAKINWSPPENLHITCRFIGEWPEVRLPDLTRALSMIAMPGPIPIHISRFGFFPNPDHPHAFFAGVQAVPSLANLARTIDQALQSPGLAPETRPYLPHVTLARIKKNSDILALREHIGDPTRFDFGAFDATDFHLFVSKPTATGSVYAKLATYDLMREKR